MALFDFLKGKKKNARRTGVRTGPADDRRPDQATQQMKLPPPPPPPPATGGAPFRSPGQSATPPEGATVVRRPQGAAPPQTQPPLPPAGSGPLPPAPPPAAQPAYPAPQHADSGQTQYITINNESAGEIVGVLAAIDGELAGQLFRIVDGRNQLGRGTDCDIELNSQKISRSHAEIIHERGTFAIMPLSDKNPTFVNDAETAGDELRDGDTIRLGLTTLKFRTL